MDFGNGKFSVTLSDGTIKHYFNKVLHNDDRPAIEYTDGAKAWYLNGKEYSEEEFNKIMKQKKLELHECIIHGVKLYFDNEYKLKKFEYGEIQNSF